MRYTIGYLAWSVGRSCGRAVGLFATSDGENGNDDDKSNDNDNDTFVGWCFQAMSTRWHRGASRTRHASLRAADLRYGSNAYRIEGHGLEPRNPPKTIYCP